MSINWNNLKNKRCIRTFYLSNDCSTIGNIYFLVYSCIPDTIGELWLQTRITIAFWCDILCALTLITAKLQVVYGRSTYRTTPLLSEMSILCVRAGCEMRLASYVSKHASQYLSDKPLVRTSTQLENYTGRMWTFSISNDCSTIGHIPCVIYSCIRELTGELRLQTTIGRSLIQCVRMRN